MIQPFLKDDALVESIREAATDENHFHLWWLGQSGFLLSWRGQRLLFDPYLSDSLTRKYAETDKPHIRMTERVIDPEKLPSVDVVTSSHNHTDHLDTETLLPILSGRRQITFIIPEANRQFVAERLRMDISFPQGLNAGESAQAGLFTINAVPAAHESIEKDEQGRCKFLGYVVQFGPWTIYHSGDTIRYDGMVEILRQWPIDIALLPINGRDIERRVAGNLDGREAAALGKEIGAKVVIPCHFEMFEFNTASPELFCAAAMEMGQKVKVLRAGEQWSSSSLDS
ncbi:MAG: MBL fold metallo-hydrolase [Verrucomicrobiales bacterium]